MSVPSFFMLCPTETYDAKDFDLLFGGSLSTTENSINAWLSGSSRDVSKTGECVICGEHELTKCNLHKVGIKLPYALIHPAFEKTLAFIVRYMCVVNFTQDKIELNGCGRFKYPQVSVDEFEIIPNKWVDGCVHCGKSSMSHLSVDQKTGNASVSKHNKPSSKYVAKYGLDLELFREYLLSGRLDTVFLEHHGIKDPHMFIIKAICIPTKILDTIDIKTRKANNHFIYYRDMFNLVLSIENIMQSLQDNERTIMYLMNHYENSRVVTADAQNPSKLYHLIKMTYGYKKSKLKTIGPNTDAFNITSLSGKRGLIRDNFMPYVASNMIRCVASSALVPGTIVVNNESNTLTRHVVVSRYNITDVPRMITNGIVIGILPKVQGSKRFEYIPIYRYKADIVLGDVLVVKVIDGDIVTVNRAPTLSKHSIPGAVFTSVQNTVSYNRKVIVYDESDTPTNHVPAILAETARIPLPEGVIGLAATMTDKMGADFDGDTINTIAPLNNEISSLTISPNNLLAGKRTMEGILFHEIHVLYIMTTNADLNVPKAEYDACIKRIGTDDNQTDYAERIEKKTKDFDSVCKLYPDIKNNSVETYRFLISLVLPFKLNMLNPKDKSQFIIRNGIYVGDLYKIYGSSSVFGIKDSNNIIVNIVRQINTKAAMKYLNMATYLANMYMEFHPSTVSLTDLFLNVELTPDLKKMIENVCTLNRMAYLSKDSVKEKYETQAAMAYTKLTAEIAKTYTTSSDYITAIMSGAKGNLTNFVGCAIVGPTYSDLRGGLLEVGKHYRGNEDIRMMGFIPEGYGKGLSPLHKLNGQQSALEAIISSKTSVDVSGHTANTLSLGLASTTVHNDLSIKRDTLCLSSWAGINSAKSKSLFNTTELIADYLDSLNAEFY